MSQFSSNSPSLPSVCNYMSKPNIIEQEMAIYNQGNFQFSAEEENLLAQEMVIYEEVDLLLASSEEEFLSRKKISKPVIDKTAFEAREEALASMKATLLKTISNVCVHMIDRHRQELRKQYKLAAEEMEAIQRKHA